MHRIKNRTNKRKIPKEEPRNRRVERYRTISKDAEYISLSNRSRLVFDIVSILTLSKGVEWSMEANGSLLGLRTYRKNRCMGQDLMLNEPKCTSACQSGRAGLSLKDRQGDALITCR